MTTKPGEPTHYLHAFEDREAAEAFSRGRWPISEVLDVQEDHHSRSDQAKAR